MLIRIILFAVIGLGSAGFGIVAWIGLHSSVPKAQAAAAPVMAHTRTVLVAAHDFAAGSLLKPEDIGNAEIDENDPRPGAWADTPGARSELVGAMVRHSLAAHEVILPADVMRPGDHGFLAAVLGPGERAVSVGVDAISGTAGLIWPGDHVDVILTQQLDAANTPVGHRIAGETVLHNARVIAIDQQLVHGGANSAAEKMSNRTVTLDVTPEGAERVAVAMRLGKLSLVVVSADQTAAGPNADPNAANADQASATPASLTAPAGTASNTASNTASSGTAADSVTWGGDVSSALRQGSGEGRTIRLFQGTTESKEFHF